MNKTLENYYTALERLKNNVPINVPIGTKINNDTVALEAGKKRGAIKSGRIQFLELVEEIKKVQEEENIELKKYKLLAEKYKIKSIEYKDLYEKSLNRELMLLERLNELEKRLSFINSIKNKG